MEFQACLISSQSCGTSDVAEQRLDWLQAQPLPWVVSSSTHKRREPQAQRSRQHDCNTCSCTEARLVAIEILAASHISEILFNCCRDAALIVSSEHMSRKSIVPCSMILRPCQIRASAVVGAHGHLCWRAKRRRSAAAMVPPTQPTRLIGASRCNRPCSSTGQQATRLSHADTDETISTRTTQQRCHTKTLLTRWQTEKGIDLSVDTSIVIMGWARHSGAGPPHTPCSLTCSDAALGCPALAQKPSSMGIVILQHGPTLRAVHCKSN